MLLKKTFRTLLRYKAQFFSMVIMIALGIGMFVGFNMEWYSLEKDTGYIFDRTKFADYRIVSENGFTAEDLQKILALDGVSAATRFLSVNTIVDGDTDVLALSINENMTVSSLYKVEGEDYDPESPDGFWLSDQYAAKNGVKVGDPLTVKYRGLTFTGTVRGLVKCGEYLICLPDETQLMPDFNSFGFAFISPAMLRSCVYQGVQDYSEQVDFLTRMGLSQVREDDLDFYFQINVISGLDKENFAAAAEHALSRTMLVLSREETASWSEAMGEVDEGKTMGSILPVLFLAIALLTMVSTMHRITASEKTQIGTLKALGFKDRRIIRHYACYALIISLIGTVLGLGLGWFVGWFIMNPGGAMGTYLDMPKWDLYVPPFCWAVLAGINLFTLLIGFLSVRQMLTGTAADALRPYTPKRMKHLRIEESRHFKALNFGTKWNLRDCLRHKSRTAMTLFGIIGCTILLVGGLGMRDTMDAFVNSFYEGAIHYRNRVNIGNGPEGNIIAEMVSSYLKGADSEAEEARKAAESRTAAEALADTLEGDWSGTLSVELGGGPISVEVYHVTRDKVRFLDDDMHFTTLGNEGVYICSRVAKENGLKTGDTLVLSPYGTDDHYEVKVAGELRTLGKSIVMTDAYADTVGIPYSISCIYTDREAAEIPADSRIASIQSKQAIIDSFDTFVELMDLMVILLVVAACLLGVVVLYNLGVMSYVERYREMATLKVVGFKDRKIGHLLISQNLWLTVLGVALGVPLGMLTLAYLIQALASEYEMKMVIGPLTYVTSTALTFGVSLVVGLMVARKNRRIDMVAALKTEE